MENADDKPHDATPKKLEAARKKGEIIRSQEFNLLTLYISILLVLSFFGHNILERVTVTLQDIINIATFPPLTSNEETRFNHLALSINKIIFLVAPIISTGFLLLIIALTIQRGILFSGTNIAPKLDRISLLSGIKKKFGANGIFEFTKSLAKLFVYIAILFKFIMSALDEIVILPRSHPRYGIEYIFTGSLSIITWALSISLILTVIDYTWQRHQFLKKQRMSLQEVKDEFKESEGDPQFKGVRRQRAIDIAMNRMMIDVPNADVLIVNPTHVSVALQWNQATNLAPIVLAKGYDEIALQIRSIAQENNIPIFEDVLAARQLCATVDIGDEIGSEHFEAAAAAIRFARSTQQRRSFLEN